MNFCGQDHATIDSNGRLKLSPRFLMDFGRTGNDVVVHCLPEGALGIYPATVWAKLRQTDEQTCAEVGRSIVLRRQLRRFGALSQTEQITNQGRLTIPVPFRRVVGLEPGTEAVLVGCEIGLEVWNAEAWEREFELLLQHERDKAAAEMQADLHVFERENIGDGRNER